MEIKSFMRNSLEKKEFKGLAAFDMDGTILKERTIDVLTKKFNLTNKLKEIDTKYKDYKEYKKAEMIAEFFKGYKAQDLLDEFRKIQVSDGIEEVIQFLKSKNFLLVIITNSYTFLAEDLAKRLGFMMCFGNKLEIKDGIITGKIEMPLNWAKQNCKEHSICKFNILKDLIEKFNFKKENVIAIGDSENDYCMLEYAGIAIAYNTQSKKLKSIPEVISSNNFFEILTILKHKIK